MLAATPTDEQLRNIGCLICHQKDYKRVKVNGVLVPDTANIVNRHVGRAACQNCHTFSRPERNLK